MAILFNYPILIWIDDHPLNKTTALVFKTVAARGVSPLLLRADTVSIASRNDAVLFPQRQIPIQHLLTLYILDIAVDKDCLAVFPKESFPESVDTL